jgi:hypothetical protein
MLSANSHLTGINLIYFKAREPQKRKRSYGSKLLRILRIRKYRLLVQIGSLYNNYSEPIVVTISPLLFEVYVNAYLCKKCRGRCDIEEVKIRIIVALHDASISCCLPMYLMSFASRLSSMSVCMYM